MGAASVAYFCLPKFLLDTALDSSFTVIRCDFLSEKKRLGAAR
jgi:hypothetical protein